MKSETQAQLDQNIPANVISTRSQAGFNLSYLETWYVIDRLNQVFGQGNWGYTTINTVKVFEGKTGTGPSEKYTVSYTATIGLSAIIDGRLAQFSDVGYGDGFDKNNPGKAHELAIKEAVSDGVKRCAKNLGRSVGLALYDKTQEYVDTAPKASPSREVNTGKVETPAPAVVTGRAESAAFSTKDLITAAFKVLEAQNKISKDAFKMNYLGNKGISTIAPSELPAIYNRMKKDFPILNGGSHGN
jgi:hypothetical protein